MGAAGAGAAGLGATRPGETGLGDTGLGLERDGAIAGRGGDLDLGQLWRALRRRRLWILLPTLAALAASAVGVNLVTPRYTGEVRLLLQSGDNYYTRPSGSSDRDSQLDERDVMSQVQIITSRDLARQAITRLGLRGNPDFDPSARPSAIRTLLEGLGVMKPVSEERAAEKLIEEYRERVLAFPVLQTRVLAVEFNATNPVLAARGADTVAELFLEAQADLKTQTAKAAGGWLGATIEPLRARVQEAEARVEAFRSRTGLLVGSNSTTLTQQQLADMNSQLTSARTAQADSQARARLIREAMKAGRPLEVSDVANNELVRKLVADQAALRAQIGLESRALLPGHPRIKELNAQLATVQQELRDSADKAARTFENEASVAKARVDSVSAALEALKQQTSTSNEDEVQLRALERDARALRDQLDALTTRYRDASAREARDSSPADAHIISRADVPSTPSFPKKVPIVLLATLATLLIAAALVITAELVSGRAFVPERAADGLRGESPVETAEANEHEEPVAQASAGSFAASPPPDVLASARPLPALAPALPGDPANDVAAEMLTPGAMASLFDTLREAAGEGFVCLVSGADRSAARDGGLRLGRALAQRCRVILVDATASAGPGGQRGLRDLGRSGIGFAEIIHRDPRSRLHLVGPGSVAPDEALNESVVANLEALRQTYDCVLVCCDRPERQDTLAEWLARQVEPVVIAAGSEAEAIATTSDFERTRPGRDRPLLMVHEAVPPMRASA
jgi:polysaccharide biosynthesis transport protein